MARIIAFRLFPMSIWRIIVLHTHGRNGQDNPVFGERVAFHEFSRYMQALMVKKVMRPVFHSISACHQVAHDSGLAPHDPAWSGLSETGSRCRFPGGDAPHATLSVPPSRYHHGWFSLHCNVPQLGIRHRHRTKHTVVYVWSLGTLACTYPNNLASFSGLPPVWSNLAFPVHNGG